jgi:hypothetical protein
VVLAAQDLHVRFAVWVAAVVERDDVVEFLGEAWAAFAVFDPCAERIDAEHMAATLKVDFGVVDGSSLLVARSLPASCGAVTLIAAVVLLALAASW